MKIWVSLDANRQFCIILYFLFLRQFQNRRTKWKKQENVTHTDVTDHKQNGSTTKSNPASQEFQSDSAPPIASKTGKSVAAELNAKITAKQNSRLKQQPVAAKSKHMEPPKMKAHLNSKSNASYNSLSSEVQVQFIDKASMMKNSYHNFHESHDVESRLSVSKIPISDFKAKSSAPVALNLKRNYL